MYNRHEMLELIVVDGRARGIVARDLVTGETRSHLADAVVLASGGYGNVFYLSTNAKGCNVTASWRAHRKGALFANPCYTQIHPTCIPVSGEHQSKLTLMSESLRNDGRVWVPKEMGDDRKPAAIPEEQRDYFLERQYPAFGNLVPRDIASRAAKAVCDAKRGVGPTGLGVYLDFSDAINRLGRAAVAAKYGNLFDMYERITGENPYEVPMRIYPAVHYTMGGLWVDYDLQPDPGLFVAGEANFSDHGANRLGASALMQGLADGYFVLPTTIGDYLAGAKLAPVPDDAPEVAEAEADRPRRPAAVDRRHPHGRLFPPRAGAAHVGLLRHGAQRRGPAQGARPDPELRREFWNNVKVPAGGHAEPVAGEGGPGRRLPRARRADVPRRAAPHGELRRHFRAESQTEEGEAARRRELLLRRRLGVHRPGPGPGPAQGGPRLRVRHPQPAELQAGD